MIVQLFNQPFAKVTRQLRGLHRLGLSHVLVSPPQKSHASKSWWARYQPVDFTRIEGPLGTLGEFHTMCQTALQLGLHIVVDTVLHHLSNEARYIRLRGGQILHAQYPYFSRNDFAGVHRLGRGRGLPILDTRSSYVRTQLRNYLHWLYELGARGFRFDSAKHMDPHVFPELLRGLPPVLCLGELVYADPESFPPAYWESMRAYDFPLARSLKQAFAPGGDLGALWKPHALWGPLSIPFVSHHDMIKNRSAFSFFRVDDRRDRELAYAFLLARQDGLPLVYGGDLRCREVKGGLLFRRAAGREPARLLAASRTVLAFRRGPSCVAAINKGGHPFELALPPGMYRDLVRGWQGHVTRSWIVPGRSAALLVRS